MTKTGESQLCLPSPINAVIYDINDQTLALLRYKKTDMSISIETICPNVPNTVSHWRLLLVYLGIIEQTLGTLPIFGFLAATAGDGNKNKLCFKEKATYIGVTRPLMMLL